MKHLIASVCPPRRISTGALLAQTVELNQEKYWKFRYRFKEYFLNKGSSGYENQNKSFMFTSRALEIVSKVWSVTLLLPASILDKLDLSMLHIEAKSS